MNHDNAYSSNMDWVREHFKLDNTTSLYTCVGLLVNAYRESLKPSVEVIEEVAQKEVKAVKPKVRRGRPPTRNKKRT